MRLMPWQQGINRVKRSALQMHCKCTATHCIAKHGIAWQIYEMRPASLIKGAVRIKQKPTKGIMNNDHI